MPQLRFSVGLVQALEGADPRPVPAYAVRAEALGFHGLWTLDSALGGPTAHTPLLDGLHALSFAAAVTNQIRLGVAVVVMSRRNPALLAHDVASVDCLSAGRMTLGVGLGAPETERVTQLGFAVDRRVRRLTEASRRCARYGGATRRASTARSPRSRGRAWSQSHSSAPACRSGSGP